MGLPTFQYSFQMVAPRCAPRSRALLAALNSPRGNQGYTSKPPSYGGVYANHVEQSRSIHTRRNVSSAAIEFPLDDKRGPAPSNMVPPSPLSCLPFSTLLRSYLITAISSYPVLLRPSLAALSFLAHSKSPIFNADQNPLLRFAIKKTFYAQFCAGETPHEIRKTVAELKDMGYRGVILGYAKEVVLEGDDTGVVEKPIDGPEQDLHDLEEIDTWEKGTMQTVDLAEKDDFVALKFTGAGRQALQYLSRTKACAPELEEAVHKICRRSQERGVRLLFDAEQASLQNGIDQWTLYFMEKYNRGAKALVYGTYQAYARKTPHVLTQHLDEARRCGFTLGVKLVRGAYMGSDRRELFWPTIEDTHQCYDSIAKSIMKRTYGDILRPVGSSSEFPSVDFVMASHNARSVDAACTLRDEQALKREPRIEMAYGTLMGMADNVSCALVQMAKERRQPGQQHRLDIPRAFKYLVWGSVGECSKYLLRRAQENQAAVSRTTDARRELGKELWRRLRVVG